MGRPEGQANCVLKGRARRLSETNLSSWDRAGLDPIPKIRQKPGANREGVGF